MNGGMLKILVLVMTTAVAAAGLTGCGRKGPLEAPDAAVAGEKRGPQETKEAVPDRPFILDAII